MRRLFLTLMIVGFILLPVAAADAAPQLASVSGNWSLGAYSLQSVGGEPCKITYQYLTLDFTGDIEGVGYFAPFVIQHDGTCDGTVKGEILHTYGEFTGELDGDKATKTVTIGGTISNGSVKAQIAIIDNGTGEPKALTGSVSLSGQVTGGTYSGTIDVGGGGGGPPPEQEEEDEEEDEDEDEEEDD